MKKVIFYLFLSLLVFLSATKPTLALTSSPYTINSFDSQIEVNQDTSLTVTETLDVNFNIEKHGIFRIIPVIYSANFKTIRADLKVLSITDINEKSIPYSVSRFGQSLKIQIGDPNKTITGPQTYIIRYRIKDTLLRYQDHDEIYWNITGHEWDTTINKSVAIVSSPFAKITKITCYQGIVGSKEVCDSNSNDQTASFYNYSPLNPGEDFTIVVGLDKNNQLRFPSFMAKTFDFIADNWGYLAALAPLAILFFIWSKKGRDLKYLSDNVYVKPSPVTTSKPVFANVILNLIQNLYRFRVKPGMTREEKPNIQRMVSLFEREHLPLVYSPINGISPSAVGTILDEKVDTKDIVAEIVELARLGFLKIERTEKKKLLGKNVVYVFTKNKKDTTKLKDYQVFLLEKIFESGTEVKLSDLKEKFYPHLEKFKDKLYKNLIEEKIFSGNPQTIKNLWTIIYLALNLLGGFLIVLFISLTGNLGPIVIFIFSVIPAIFLIKNMPRRTAWGHSLYRQIVGLHYFLDKGKWREEIAEKNLFLEEILPLAIALGLVHKLAKDMQGLGIEPPSYLNGFVATSFARDLDHFSSQTAGTLTSSPGKSWSGKSSWTGGSGFSGGGGGGSSGGGFGGGGGGSW